MKYFIAFMLLWLTNCLVPTAILAATNPTNVATRSVVFPAKKSSFKQRLSFKFSAKSTWKITKITILLGIGILLMLAGLILFFGGIRETKASLNNYDALAESVFGMTAFCLGFICSVAATTIIFKRRRKMKLAF